MDDEAVVRIILQDEGGLTAKSTPAPAAPTPSPTKLTPPPPPPVPVKPVVPPPAQSPTAPQSTSVPPPAQTDWLRNLIAPKEGANPHVLLEGQSGSGKSLAAKHIAFERMKMGHDVHVVDTHTPESWGGAKQVFQGQSAGTEAAKFMLELLQERKREASEAKLKGELPDFKPVSIVLSDFARLMKDTPQLGDEFKTLLTEARKFRISIVADTTALTGAASGIKGIMDVRANFGQQAVFKAPTADDPQRTARLGGTGGEVVDVPNLPDYKDKIDFGLVKPPEDTDLNLPVGAAAAARRRLEKEKYDAEVQAEYEKLNPPAPKLDTVELAYDPVEVAKKRVEQEEQRRLADEEYKKLKPPELPKADIFDPKEIAKKRIEREKQQKEIDDAYKKMKPKEPEKQKSGMDSFLDMAGQFRGLIGGRFGSVAGGALDAISAMRAPSGATGGASGAAGGMAGMAGAAAGPVAVAMAVKEGVRELIAGAGNVASFLSSPDDDPSKMMHGMSEAIGKLSFVTGEVGKVVAGLMDNFTRMGEKYGQYNPQIAQAQAMAEISKEMRDMARAQQSGGELARFIKAQSEMQQKFEDIKIKIWMQILPIMTGILDVLNFFLPSDEMVDIVDPTSIILNQDAVNRSLEGSTRPLSVRDDTIR